LHAVLEEVVGERQPAIKSHAKLEHESVERQHLVWEGPPVGKMKQQLLRLTTPLVDKTW
jgi:hypothetical protein